MSRKQTLITLSLLLIAALVFTACAPADDEPSAAEAAESQSVADEHDEDDGHHEDEGGHADNHADGHGHDDDHDLNSGDPIAGAEEVRIVAKEWGFEPASVHLHAGEPVNIVLVNEGTIEHEVELEAFGFHAHAQPGETVTVGLVPEETGEFEFGCFVPGHYEAGMKGDVVVEAAH